MGRFYQYPSEQHFSPPASPIPCSPACPVPCSPASPIPCPSTPAQLPISTKKHSLSEVLIVHKHAFLPIAS